MPATRARAADAVLIAVSVVTVLLAGEAVRRTVAHGFETQDPALALRWEPSDPAAREALADRLTAAAIAGRSPGAISEASAEAKRVLAAAPLRWAALRDIGLAADMSGDAPAAAAVMARAALRGHRDVAVEAWWLQHALTAGDTPGAIARLNAILRVAPELQPRLLPVILALVNADGTTASWSATMAADPPWRQPVIDDVALKDTDLDAIGRLFAALRTRGSPASANAYGVFLTRLALAGRYAEARTVWSRFAGADTTAPYDGDFSGRAAPAPFNWRIVQPEGGVVTAGPSLSGRTALTAVYPASTAPLIAEQLLTLPPGAYRLSGRWRVDRPAPGAAVLWTVTCATPATPLAAWRHGTDVAAGWTSFELPLTVPTGCPGQWLRLSARAGDGFGDVATAFTGLRVGAATR